MKKIIKTTAALLLTLVLTAFSAVPALASDFKEHADTLKNMELFIGSDIGYELDRAPTRAEAAVMLVRLLGKEAEVKAGTYNHPFKDVPKWVDKYVGYLYENSLTKGTSSISFGTDEQCSAQMYSAFVLRALGYTEDNGDYSYEEAEDFSYYIGLRMESLANTSFLRDDMVGMSYSALFQDMNGSDEILFDKLISQNAIKKEEADKIKQQYELYNDYLAAIEASYINGSSDISLNTTVDVDLGGEKSKYTQEDRTVTVVEGDKVRFKSVLTTPDGEYPETVTYYEDGWVYVKTDDSKIKYQMDVSIDDYLYGANSSVILPFYMIDSIRKSVYEDRVEYYISYIPEIYDTVYSYLQDELKTMSVDIYIDKTPAYDYINFNTDGIMMNHKSIVMLTAGLNDYEYPISVSIIVKSITEINATEDAVGALEHVINPDEYEVIDTAE